MQLRLGSGAEVTEPDDAEIAQAIRSLVSVPAADAFAVLGIPNGESYMQGMRVDSYAGKTVSGQQFVVEYRDASARRHYRINDVPIDTVLALFLAYNNHQSSWKRNFSWSDVSRDFKWDRTTSEAKPRKLLTRNRPSIATMIGPVAIIDTAMRRSVYTAALIWGIIWLGVSLFFMPALIGVAVCALVLIVGLLDLAIRFVLWLLAASFRRG